VWVDRSGRAERIETVPAGPLVTPRLSPDGLRVLLAKDGDAWVFDLADGRSTKLTGRGRFAPPPRPAEDSQESVAPTRGSEATGDIHQSVRSKVARQDAVCLVVGRRAAGLWSALFGWLIAVICI
jgi:hypothetical protein